MSGVDKIRNRLYRPILPLVYTEALSYMEMLAKVGAKINEVIDYIDGFKEDLQTLVDDAIEKYSVEVDQKLNDLIEYVDEQDNTIVHSITEFIDMKIRDIQDEVNGFEKDVTTRLNIMNNKLVSMRAMIDANKEYLIAYIDLENAKQDEKAQEEYSKIRMEIASIERTYPPMFNPFTGNYTPVSDVVLDMYKYFRYFAFTCGEWDALDITCAEYDSKYISAIDFDLYGKMFFDFFNKLMNIVNPYTGKRDAISNVISHIASHTSEYNISAEDYDSLGLTADEYDTNEFSAESYDFAGAEMVGKNVFTRLTPWSDGKYLYRGVEKVTIDTQSATFNGIYPKTADIIGSEIILQNNDYKVSLNGNMGDYHFEDGNLNIMLKEVPVSGYNVTVNILFAI